MGKLVKVPFYFIFLGLLKFIKFIYKSTNLAYNEATIRACRLVSREWKHGQNGRNGVPYSREVARFALFGGRLPKVKVLTADVPISEICVVLIINKKKSS
jgi:hypothetical protein